MMKLVEPKSLNIKYEPSAKQYELWKCLQPNYCNKCGGKIYLRVVGEDKRGNPLYKAVCDDCGNDNIPQKILAGGSAGGGKTFTIACWLISSCLRFPGIRAIVGRKTLKSLKESTWLTIMEVLEQWGLKIDENFHVNNVSNVITFFNGSTIRAIEMSASLQDPEYQRFGSMEATIAAIDEVAEVPEKAVEILFSRLRYMIADTFIVPKLLMTCNPTLNWPKRVFVSDDDGNPPKLGDGMYYIPFSLFDNPNIAFRTNYFAILSKMRNAADRERLLYGNWDFIDTNKEAAYWAFNGDKHLVTKLREQVYSKLRPLILVWDFNCFPRMSVLAIQIDYDKKKFYVLEEISGTPEEKLNNTPALAKYINQKYINEGHLGGLIISGDPSGKSRSSQTEDGVNNYTIIMSQLDRELFRPQLKIFDKQPGMVTRLEFVNEMLNGYNGWEVLIDLRCRRLTEDLVYQKKNEDGTKEKKKVADDSGHKSEQYGHYSDDLDYGLTYFCGKLYSRFKAHVSSPVITVPDSVSAYDTANQWDY